MADYVEQFECIDLSEGGVSGKPRVDRARGLIFNVKCLGWKSLNGRVYEPAGVDPALYEGGKVCVDHVKPGVSRSSRDTVGVLEGTTKTATGIFAKQLRLLNPEGEFEKRLMAAAEFAPHAFGLSHTAQGRVKPGSYGSRIAAVEKVSTVDIVDDPATVAGLYESRGFVMKKAIKDLAESLASKRPGYARALREVAEAGIVDPAMGMDDPGEVGGDEPADHEQALRDACVAVLNDDSLSSEEMLKNIKIILKMIDGDAPAGDSPADTPAEESRRGEHANLREEVARLRAEKAVRKAAAAAGLAVGEALLEALARPGITEAQAAAAVAELRGAGGGSQRPRSAAPPAPPAGGRGVRESRGNGNGGDIPSTPKERAAWLRRD
jgi:hypothetical protein